MGHRSLYHDGWRAVNPWPGPSFTESGGFFGDPISKEKLTQLDADKWELYHVDADFAENHDVAGDNRDRLISMIGTWYVEAGKYNVLPVDGRGTVSASENEAAGGSCKVLRVSAFISSGLRWWSATEGRDCCPHEHC